jgi:hypothetical protein
MMNNDWQDLTLLDVENKTPALEQLLLKLAKEAGAEQAVLFDGSVINLVNSGDE